MGAAISLVIETQNENGEWIAITGEIWVPRDWDLFCAIAFGDGGDVSVLPYPPRGLPHDHSIVTRNSYFDPDKKGVSFFNIKTMTFEETTAPSKIKKWLGKDKVLRDVYSKYGLLPIDEIVETSWLNLAELEEAMEYRGVKKDAMSKEFQKVLSKMTKSAKKLGKEKVRIVFWFTL